MNNNEILDFDLDMLEDLPEFVTLPAGTYLVEGVALDQDYREKQGTCIVVKVKVLETIELKNPETDKAPDAGTVADWSCALANPDGNKGITFSQGQIKLITSALGKLYGVTKFSELASKFPGTQFAIVTTLRYGKDEAGAVDKDKKYSGIKAVIVE